MFLVILSVLFYFIYTIESSIISDDPCSQYSPCSECVKHSFCGWCSNNVTYRDGTDGLQCAGFNKSDPMGKPFTCSGRYQTTICEVGYICDKTNYTCMVTTPGDGEDKKVCEEKCIKPAPVYACNETTYECFETEPGKGKSLPLCEAECASHYSCNLTSLTCEPNQNGDPKIVCESSCGKAHNNTPSDLIGIWRGLEISEDYVAGEYDVKFTATNVTILFPESNGTKVVGFVQTLDTPPQVWITVTSGPPELEGKVLRSIYKSEFTPELVLVTIAFGAPDEPAPQNFDDAMVGANKGTVLVIGRCLSTNDCRFLFPNGMVDLPTYKSFGTTKSLPLDEGMNLNPLVNDSCMPFPTCEECISHQYCGWCSNKVVYDDGENGTHCAGFNPDMTKKPFVCSGTYTTDNCPIEPTAPAPVAPIPPAAKLYGCNASHVCVVQPGGEHYDECKAHCEAPPRNVTPPALIGTWRGFRIDVRYGRGEWKAVFNATMVTISDPKGETWEARVAGDSSFLWLYPLNGPYAGSIIKGLFQIAYDVETKDLTWAWGKPGGAQPSSFSQAMLEEGMTEYTYVSCMFPSLCKFDH